MTFLGMTLTTLRTISKNKKAAISKGFFFSNDNVSYPLQIIFLFTFQCWVVKSCYKMLLLTWLLLEICESMINKQIDATDSPL